MKLPVKTILILVAGWILTIAVSVVYTWFERGRQKDKEWEAKIASAPAVTTSTSTTVNIPQPPDSGTSKPRPVKRPSTGVSETVFRMVRMERDSLQELLEEELSPHEGTIYSPALGRLEYLWDPLTDRLHWEHFPPPKEIRIDSVFVERMILKERPWWEAPAYVAGGAGLVIVTQAILRRN